MNIKIGDRFVVRSGYANGFVLNRLVLMERGKSKGELREYHAGSFQTLECLLARLKQLLIMDSPATNLGDLLADLEEISAELQRIDGFLPGKVDRCRQESKTTRLAS